MATRLQDFAISKVAVVEPETTALVVSKLMRQHHIGALVVVEAGGKNRPVGIVTDRDLVLELMSQGLIFSTIYIYFHNFYFFTQNFCQLIKNWTHHYTRTTPGCPKIHQNG